MTSGEVLFILAFIVLPTTVLVSSVWAVVFVRRRPQRVIPRQYEETVQDAENDTADAQDTALVTVVERAPATNVPSNTQVAAASEETYDEPAPEPVSEPWQPEPAHESVATNMPQSTEDLDEIVARITELESVVEPLEPVDFNAEEIQEPEPAFQDNRDAEPAFSQTSELPAIDPFAPEATQSQSAPPPERAPVEAREEPESGWRRRRRDVKLRPAEAEAPRKRGRNRDSDRQVPQLGRSARRRDTSPRGTPPDHDPDQDSASGNR